MIKNFILKILGLKALGIRYQNDIDFSDRYFLPKIAVKLLPVETNHLKSRIRLGENKKETFSVIGKIKEEEFNVKYLGKLVDKENKLYIINGAVKYVE